ncbi:hypothetical protein Rhe02_77660 [Rhizocola hellebori]|uniref:DUF2339 domain-containing protein n=1 Tax=Rhizocola hellebori TaxID=1392758 RepID=A0A8J3VJR9_9ACTN|nr:hypothetical protein Rhe02_77660 [Rhizocola hellebori]
MAALTAERLFGYAPMFLGESLTSVQRHLSAILALAAVMTIAAVFAFRSLRRAGGWLVPLAGLAVVLGCIWLFTYQPELAETGQVPLTIGYGIALGGVLAAAAAGGSRERVAVAIGVAFGLATGAASIRLITPEVRLGSNLPLYATLPVALVAAWVVVAASLSPRPAEPSAQRRGLLMPMILAAALYVIVLVGNPLRPSIVDGFSSRRGLSAEYSAVGLALLVALILVWYGYRVGKAQLARWLLVCLALAGPATLSVIGFQYGRYGTGMAMVAVAAVAATAGGLLAHYVVSDLPWELIGIGAAALGMVLSSVAQRSGPPSAALTVLLIAGGVAFAFGSGLVSLLGTIAEPMTALSLGLVTLILAADAMRPATMIALQPIDSDAPRLSVSVVSALAALGIVALRPR